MHTPEQARELWCPMVRKSNTVVVLGYKDEPTQTFCASGVNIGSTRHHEPVAESVSCIADKCAMWRWHITGETRSEFAIIPIGDGQYKEGTKQVPVTPTHGYCGLAGNPYAHS